MTTYEERYNHLVAHVAANIPGFEVRFKDIKYPNDPWQRAVIDRVALIFAKDYLTEFATTIPPFVYFPGKWRGDYKWLYRILRHEFIHLMDDKCYGLWFRFSYVAVAPVLFTMRAYWERRGYAQSLIEIHERRSIRQHDIDFFVSQFTSRNYFWMDPWARPKIEHLVSRIESGEIKGLWPYNTTEE